MSPEWLLVDGRPVADRFVLSHPEQVARLAVACPEAVRHTAVAGDPCFDRLLAAVPYRERFRRAFGVRPGQRLVVVNSTWNPESLFGTSGEGDVLARLVAGLTQELPLDSYRLAFVLHPNIWHGHGPGQVRYWLSRAEAAGAVLVDPVRHWRQALVASDLVIGDFSSVTCYAASIGVPVTLAARGREVLDSGSPVGRFVERMPCLDFSAGLLPQVERAIANPPGVVDPREFITSLPAESAQALRTLFYDTAGLPEPETPAAYGPLPLPPYMPLLPSAPVLVTTGVDCNGRTHVTRHATLRPRTMACPAGSSAVGTHVVVHEDTDDPNDLAVADVVYRFGPRFDPRLGRPADWAADVLARHPAAATAVYLVENTDTCIVLPRHRSPVLLECESSVEPLACASAFHAWTAEQPDAGRARYSLIAVIGGVECRIAVRPLPSRSAGGDA